MPGLRTEIVYGISNVFPYPGHNDDINTNFSLLCVYEFLMSQLKHLGTTGRNQNLIQEEIKTRLNSGNACYHSVQNLLSSRLLLRNVKIRIYKTIILPVVLYACETWSLTLKEEHRLRVFENRVLRRIIGPKRDKVTRGWEHCRE
jgi:hypothetical protein